jgi:hypothetical protein
MQIILEWEDQHYRDFGRLECSFESGGHRAA